MTVIMKDAMERYINNLNGYAGRNTITLLGNII